MHSTRFYFFFGTTAEFIKLAPIIKKLKKRKEPFKLFTSGQNNIKLGDFSSYLGDLKIEHAFPEKPHQSSLFLFFIWTIMTFFRCLFYFYNLTKKINKKKTFFIIHGDTVSALISATVFRILGFKIAHVEAGLRSFDFFEPFPEEICRFIINHLSTINFAQNDWSLKNLKNVKSEKVNTKENTLIELFWWAIKKNKGLDYAKKFNKYYILILHRQEHIYFNKKWTRNIMKFVLDNANKNLNCLFIMHPLTTKFLESENLNIESMYKKLFLVPKLPYAEFMTLMNNAEFIATDGCTNQEEVYYMGLPCLALRHRTERVEGLNENFILSKSNEKIIKKFLKSYNLYRRKPAFYKQAPSQIVVDYLLAKQ